MAEEPAATVPTAAYFPVSDTDSKLRITTANDFNHNKGTVDCVRKKKIRGELKIGSLRMKRPWFLDPMRVCGDLLPEYLYLES